MIRTLIFLVFSFVIFPSFAQIAKTVEPAWLRQIIKQPIQPDLDDISEGYYYELLDYQVDISSKTRYSKSIKVIFDNNGIENAGELFVAFNPEYQKLSIHELKIIREGKEIDKLDIKKFKVISSETEVHRSLYNGTKSAYYIIEDVREGDKIVFAYSLQGFNSVFEGKFFDAINLQGYEPIGLIHVNFIAPSNRKLFFKSYNGAQEPSKEIVNGNVNYHWESSNTGKKEFDIYSPSWDSNLEWIECSEYANWKEVSDWVGRINPIRTITAHSELGRVIDKLWTESSGDPYQFLKLATDLVQNDVRYLGIEVGEYSHRASNPEKVFSQRYGDCKDKSVLLASILTSKGIPANIVLTNINTHLSLTKRLPSPWHFNHMIVSVTINDREQYIDPTITNQGGDIRNRFTPYYGNCLNLNFPKEITTIPTDFNNKVSIHECYELIGNSEAILKVETRYVGGSADVMRQYFKDNAKNIIQKAYYDYYSKLYPKINKIEALKYSDDPANNLFVVYESYKIQDIGTYDNQSRRKIFALYANNINEKLPIIPESHKGKVALEFPMRLEYDISIVDPSSSKFKDIVDNINLDRTAYFFNKYASVKGDSLLISYRINFHESFINESDLEMYRSDFEQRDYLLYNGFYLNDQGQLDNTSVNNNFYPWAIILFLAIIVGAGFFIKRYNRTSVEIISDGVTETYYSIGGWLVVLAISCSLTLFKLLIFFLGEESLLRSNIWKNLPNEYLINTDWYIIMICYELAINTLLFVFMGYSLFLLFKRRDIFPRTLFYTLLIFPILAVLDTFLTIVLFGHFSSVVSYSDLFSFLFFSTIWCLYLKYSKRVKYTFVNPYVGNNLHE